MVLDIGKKDNVIQIAVTKDDINVYCIISDTGNSEKQNKKLDGYISKGHALTIERLKVLYKNCRNQPSIKNEINPLGGWDVIINIPLV